MAPDYDLYDQKALVYGSPPHFDDRTLLISHMMHAPAATDLLSPALCEHGGSEPYILWL